MDLNHLINIGITAGAKNIVKFSVRDIVFDPRTILKCMFGCSDWGYGHTCPSRPGALKPWEYKKIFKKYSWGYIIHAHDKTITQKASYAIEREAYLNGYYMAFSLSDCALCKECAGRKHKPCVNPKMARPAFHSVGIDVFKTVQKFHLPLHTLKHEGEEQNWYAAVFIE